MIKQPVTLLKMIMVSMIFALGCGKKLGVAASSRPPANKPAGDGWNCILKARVLGPCLHWEWKTLPTFSADGSMLITLYKIDQKTGQPIPFTLNSEIAMRIFLVLPAKTHPSDKSPVVTNLGGGQYRAEQFHFNDYGLWQISFLFEQGGRALDVVDENYQF